MSAPSLQSSTSELLGELERALSGLSERPQRVYVLTGASESVWWTATLLSRKIEADGVGRALLVTTSAAGECFAKMCLPEVPLLPASTFSHPEAWAQGRDRIALTPSGVVVEILFVQPFWARWEADVRAGREAHFYHAVRRGLGLERSSSCGDALFGPRFSADVRERALDKLRRAGVNPERFVFLAPESRHMRSASPAFWAALAQRLRETGTDVYVNVTQPGPDFKRSSLTFEEALAAAECAGAAVGMMSGLTAPLCVLKRAPVVCLMGERPAPSDSLQAPLSSAEVLRAQSVALLPGNGRWRREFDLNATSESALVRVIVDELGAQL